MSHKSGGTLRGPLRFVGTGNPGTSAPGEGRIYFDASSNKFLSSVNGGSYVQLSGTLQSSYDTGGGSIALTNAGGPLSLTAPSGQNLVALDASVSGTSQGIRLRNTASATGSGFQAVADFGFSDGRRVVLGSASDSGVSTEYNGRNYLSYFGKDLSVVAGTGAVNVARFDGAGNVILRDAGAPIGTGSANGFTYLPQTADAPPGGTPAQLPSGAVPVTFGSDNALYAFYSSAWHQVGGGSGGGTLTVQAFTSGATLTTTQSGLVATNQGATSEVILTLPPVGTPGLVFEFAVQTNQYLRVANDPSTTINLGAATSATGGYVRSNTPGSYIRLVAISTTQWFALVGGLWSVDA